MSGISVAFVPRTVATAITLTGTFLSSAAAVTVIKVDTTTASCTFVSNTITTVVCNTPVLPVADVGTRVVKLTIGGATTAGNNLEFICALLMALVLCAAHALLSSNLPVGLHA